jgi:hypothetical protein
VTAGLAHFGVVAFSGPTCDHDSRQILCTLSEAGAQYLGLPLKILNGRHGSALGRVLGD